MVFFNANFYESIEAVTIILVMAFFIFKFKTGGRPMIQRIKNSQQGNQLAAAENISPAEFWTLLEGGRAVVPWNPKHKSLSPIAIGKGLKTKVNASIGMYHPNDTLLGELDKASAAVAAGADTIMDLSVRGDINGLYRTLLAEFSQPIGTLPLYQALSVAQAKRGSALKMETEDIFETIEKQAEDGIDFMAFHPGVTRELISRAKNSRRIDPLVSFGGSHLMGWMIHNKKENPLFEQYDRLLNICKKYGVTLSLADAMRPGTIADSLDGPMVEELVILGDMVTRAREAGVQVMVKGPGHMPLNHIAAAMQLQESLCHGAPYFVFGPLLTDVAAGYDHLNAAIGGALSSYFGADFLCYVTAAEHLGLPDKEQVREGVIAAKIAAHAGDIAKGVAAAAKWDLDMSLARKNLNWKEQMALAIAPQRAREIWETRNPAGAMGEEGCAMCGKYCAMKIISKYLDLDRVYQC